jgi:8-oxo-dGTP diphosphatase
MPIIAANPMIAATDTGLPVTKMVLVSAVALIDRDGRVLLAQRPEGIAMAGLWEFPGGKIESSETPEAALIRELHEELGIDTAASCLAPLSFASHSYAATQTHPAFHLLMMLYVCRRWQGHPLPVEGGQLKWVRPQQLRDYPMPAADIPLVAALQDLL